MEDEGYSAKTRAEIKKEKILSHSLPELVHVWFGIRTIESDSDFAMNFCKEFKDPKKLKLVIVTERKRL